MKMTTLHTHVAVLAVAVLSLSTSGRAQSDRASRAPAAGPIAIPMTADHWQTKENAEFLRQLGFFRGLMRLNSGNAVLKDTTFSDGTIEFDVMVEDDDYVGQETDEESGYWLDARVVGVRERKTRVRRQEPV